MRLSKRTLLCALFAAAAAAPARPQGWGIGGTYGSVNNVDHSFTLDGFKPSEYTVFVDYKFEQFSLLRMTYGSMWTQQANVGQMVPVAGGSYPVPSAKERINYLTADVSYLFWEGFYTGGVFGGIGGYNFKPQPMQPAYAAYQDPEEKVFGWNAGIDGEFRVTEVPVDCAPHHVPQHHGDPASGVRQRGRGTGGEVLDSSDPEGRGPGRSTSLPFPSFPGSAAAGWTPSSRTARPAPGSG